MDNMIGQRIKERRKEMHITQAQIQQSCGISSGNLSGIETGRYLPSAIALIELARILKCSVDWILTGESLDSKNLVCVDIKETDKQLLEYFHGMSEGDQEDLLLIAEMKANKGKRKIKSSLSNADNSEFETA
ncbi:MAG: helix-turn-helix domain-containing protein [Lachnospiraceae bacterium]|nr:helix-turn-helix domain-containing protein [Lachnospiraceae bacterium]MDE6251127.1 helix-turn-helix domain-containing protein [Lachnospiraceae bacterium]